MTPWELQGTELVNCSCDYACPCQFNALPTGGACKAIGAIAIDKGHHGAVPLDGLKVAFVFRWPGPIHEGHGEAQLALEERATPAQREALLKIVTGQDTEPFATMFAVFASTLEKVHEPLYTTIDFRADVDRRRGEIHVEKLFDLVGEPILNPITREEHRVRIDMPNGFEYEIAEIGRGSSSAKGPLAFSLEDSYAQFARLHLNNQGVVRHRAVA